MGTPLSPISRRDHDRASEAAREALGQEAFEAAYAAGRQTPLEKAITAALAG